MDHETKEIQILKYEISKIKIENKKRDKELRDLSYKLQTLVCKTNLAAVLSVKQPAAELIVSNIKDVENRTSILIKKDSLKWVIIASSATYMKKGSMKVNNTATQEWIDTLHPYNYPLSVVIGAAEICDIVDFEEATLDSIWAYKQADELRAVKCIRFNKCVKFKHPIPYKGVLGVLQRFDLNLLHVDDYNSLKNITLSNSNDLLRLFQR